MSLFVHRKNPKPYHQIRKLGRAPTVTAIQQDRITVVGYTYCGIVEARHG